MIQKRPILRYVLAYTLWILSTGLGILVLNLARETLLLGMVVSSNLGEPTQSEKFYASLRAAAASSWSILVLGLLALILLVGIENYYRMSVPSGKLSRRFFLVSGIECVVLFLTHSSYYALLQTFRPSGWTAFAFPAVEFVLAALLLWIFYFLKSKARKAATQ